MNNEEPKDEETAKEKLEKIASTSDLDTAIKRLEGKRLLMEDDLKGEMHTLIQNLKPSTILKNTIHEVQQSTDLKNNLFKVALGLGAGYFSRKLVVGKSAGFVKKALGTALQYGITNFISKKNGKESTDNYTPKKKNLFKRILSI